MLDVNPEQPTAGDLGQRVATAINLLPGMGEHARWLLGEVMRQVKPRDLLPEEIMGVLAILAPAHNRKLKLAGHPPGSPLVHTIIDPVTGRHWLVPHDAATDLS